VPSHYRVLVTGSREAQTAGARAAIAAQFDRLRDYANATGSRVVIIHGGARGVDSIAHAEAKKRHFATVVVYPQWDDYDSPAKAAYDRNVQMVTEFQPAACLAFNAGTRGTQHQIEIAQAHGVPVREIPIQR